MARKKRTRKQENHTSLTPRRNNVKTKHNPSSIGHVCPTDDAFVTSSTDHICQRQDYCVMSSQNADGPVCDMEENSLSHDQPTSVSSRSVVEGVTLLNSDLTYITSDLMSTSEESLAEGVGAHVTVPAYTDCSTNRTRLNSADALCSKRKRTRSRAVTCEDFLPATKRKVSKRKRTSSLAHAAKNRNSVVEHSTRKKRTRMKKKKSTTNLCFTDDVDLPKIFPPASCHRKLHCDVMKSLCAKTATETGIIELHHRSSDVRNADSDVTKPSVVHQIIDVHKCCTHLSKDNCELCCKNTSYSSAEYSTDQITCGGSCEQVFKEKTTSRGDARPIAYTDHQYSRIRPKTPVTDMKQQSSGHALAGYPLGKHPPDSTSYICHNARPCRRKKYDHENQEKVLTGQCVHDNCDNAQCTTDCRCDDGVTGGVKHTHLVHESDSNRVNQCNSRSVDGGGSRLLAIVDKLARQARSRDIMDTKTLREKLDSKKSKKDDQSIATSSNIVTRNDCNEVTEAERKESSTDYSDNRRSSGTDTAPVMTDRSSLEDNTEHDSPVSQRRDLVNQNEEKDIEMNASLTPIAAPDTGGVRHTLYKLRRQPDRHSNRLKTIILTSAAHRTPILRDDVRDDKHNTTLDDGKSHGSRVKDKFICCADGVCSVHSQIKIADVNVDVDNDVRSSTEDVGDCVEPGGESDRCIGHKLEDQVEFVVIDHRQVKQSEYSLQEQTEMSADTHDDTSTSVTSSHGTYKLQDCFIDLGSRITGSMSTGINTQISDDNEKSSEQFRGHLNVDHMNSMILHLQTANTDNDTATQLTTQQEDITDEETQRKAQPIDLHNRCTYTDGTKAISNKNPTHGSKPNDGESLDDNKNATVRTVTRNSAHGQQRKAVKIRYPTGEEKFVLINSSTRVTSGILTSSVEHSKTGAEKLTVKSSRTESEVYEELMDKSKQQDCKDLKHQDKNSKRSKEPKSVVRQSNTVTETPMFHKCAASHLGKDIDKKPIHNSGVPVKKLKVGSGQMMVTNSTTVSNANCKHEHNVSSLPSSMASPESVSSQHSDIKVKSKQMIKVNSCGVSTESDVSRHSAVTVTDGKNKHQSHVTAVKPKPVSAGALTNTVKSMSVSTPTDLPQHCATQKNKHKNATSLTASASVGRDVISESLCSKAEVSSKHCSLQKLTPKLNMMSLTSAPKATRDVVMYLHDEWQGDRSSRTVMYIPHQCLERMLTAFQPGQSQHQQSPLQSQDKVLSAQSQDSSDGKPMQIASKESNVSVKQGYSGVKNANPTVKCENLEQKNPKPDEINPTPKKANTDMKDRSAGDKNVSSEAARNNTSQKQNPSTVGAASCDTESAEDSDYVDRLIAKSHRAYYVAGSQVVRHNGVTWCRSRVITVYHSQLGSVTSRVTPPYLQAVLVYDSNPSLAIMIVSRVCPGIYLVESTHGQLLQRRHQRQHVYETALLKPYPLASLDLLPDNVSDFWLAVGPVERVWRRASARLAAVDMTQSVISVLKQVTGNRECRCFASRWWQQMGAPGRDGGKGVRPRKKKLLTMKQLDGRLQRLALFNCSCPECDPFKRKRKTKFLVAKEKSEKVKEENSGQSENDGKCQNNRNKKGLMVSHDADSDVEVAEIDVTKYNVIADDVTNSTGTASDSKESLTVDVTKSNLTAGDVTIENVTPEDDSRCFDNELNVESDASNVCPESVDETDVYVDVMGSPGSCGSLNGHSLNVTQASQSAGRVSKLDKPSSTKLCRLGKTDSQISAHIDETDDTSMSQRSLVQKSDATENQTGASENKYHDLTRCSSGDVTSHTQSLHERSDVTVANTALVQVPPVSQMSGRNPAVTHTSGRDPTVNHTLGRDPAISQTSERTSRRLFVKFKFRGERKY